MIELRRYLREDESAPITDWLCGLRDIRARAQIEVRLRRVSAGNFGDCKPVGKGVWELRVDIRAIAFENASFPSPLVGEGQDEGGAHLCA